jgi:hypothetical protein
MDDSPVKHSVSSVRTKGFRLWKFGRFTPSFAKVIFLSFQIQCEPFTVFLSQLFDREIVLLSVMSFQLVAPN